MTKSAPITTATTTETTKKQDVIAKKVTKDEEESKCFKKAAPRPQYRRHPLDENLDAEEDDDVVDEPPHKTGN